jgi:hypothetical protein
MWNIIISFSLKTNNKILSSSETLMEPEDITSQAQKTILKYFMFSLICGS